MDGMKLLVPLDGAASCRRALDLAIHLAQSLPGSSIVLVNVRNAESIGLADAGAVLPLSVEAEEEGRIAGEILAEAAAVCRNAGVVFIERSAAGPIAETIVAIAREEHADQIIMGTRGLGAFRGLLIGSTATHVLHATELPVTLVK
jgi:nucleotide-binding universal stress UspA family protein